MSPTSSSTAPATAPRAAAEGPDGRRTRSGGPLGNQRLTALLGTLLLLMFAAQGVTILFLGRMLTWHFVIGLSLIGPVAAKLVTVCYRAARYYTGADAYRRQGTPPLALRLLGPLVIATTVALLATGSTLALTGERTAAGLPILFLHKASFVCWAGAMGLHVLAHIWRLPRLLGADLRRRTARHGGGPLPGRALRRLVPLLAL
ncbi:hypothetical protein, partial [Kitasatospora sp. LaBMicrA B282]|uniref:hypothetical protein n=1 Tax=Kitasatospora sp. LaBMicrA B282 TaxID=3420949 RepID=UPI003D0A605D